MLLALLFGLLALLLPARKVPTSPLLVGARGGDWISATSSARGFSMGDEPRHTDATSIGVFGSELCDFEAIFDDDDFDAGKGRCDRDSHNLGVDWNRLILVGIDESSSGVLRRTSLAL
ncbi:hypothetical protein Dimus_008177, partial [Dionaea muscipula]